MQMMMIPFSLLFFAAAVADDTYCDDATDRSKQCDCTNQTFIMSIAMDADFGNTLFVGNKSKNTFIEIMLGGNIYDKNVETITRLKVVEPDSIYGRATGFVHDIDLRLAPKFDFVNNTFEVDDAPKYADITSLGPCDLIYFVHGETNTSTINRDDFPTPKEGDPDETCNGDNRLTRRCLCTENSPFSEPDPDTGLSDLKFVNCERGGKRFPTRSGKKIQGFVAQDLEFPDIFVDVLVFGETADGEEVQIAQYYMEDRDKYDTVIEQAPTNQFDREFYVGAGGFSLEDSAEAKKVMSYGLMITDREDDKPQTSDKANYRWPPAFNIGRQLNPFATKDGPFTVKSGRTLWHAKYDVDYHNLGNIYDTRAHEIRSQLTFNSNLRDHKIRWNVSMDYYRTMLAEEISGREGKDGVVDFPANSEGSAHWIRPGSDMFFAPYWLPDDPNNPNSALHIAGTRGTTLSVDDLMKVDSSHSCEPMFEWEEGSSYFDPLADEKDWTAQLCPPADSAGLIAIPPVTPSIPPPITQPIFRSKYFDSAISSGSIFLSNVALMTLGSHNVIAAGSDSHQILKTPESHYALETYFEFPILPGTYRSTGSTSSNIGMNPWLKNLRRSNNCTDDLNDWTSDLQNYVHDAVESAEPDQPSLAWHADPAYGYCDYCAHDVCCCLKLNNSANITQEMNNYGYDWTGNNLSTKKTGWSNSLPIDRLIQPCNWDENRSTCVRSAQTCSDCTDVGVISAEPCCLNLSQAPDGPKCIFDSDRSICSDAPLDCSACNILANTKDCCDVQRDSCTYLKTNNVCIDIPTQCSDCTDKECCSDMAGSMLCKWDDSQSQCVTDAAECDACAIEYNGTLYPKIWIEGCCNGLRDCTFVNDSCLETPTSCLECNALDEHAIYKKTGVEITTMRKDCCQYGGLDCLFVDYTCYDMAHLCSDCNVIGADSKLCCLAVANSLACLWEDSVGCSYNEDIGCEYCNAFFEREGCCEERPWCVWYNKIGEDTVDSKVGTCEYRPTTCEDCNRIPFKQACCDDTDGCSMFGTMCHPDGFDYWDKCDAGYLYGNVILASACIATLGFFAAMLTHYLLRDIAPDQVIEQQPDEFVITGPDNAEDVEPENQTIEVQDLEMYNSPSSGVGHSVRFDDNTSLLSSIEVRPSDLTPMPEEF
eukprot:GHVH01001323.1.p1 GENE.GHVH01001323.1~~GHVH01001323.1.p1  ORF type:complete len:1157 (+),score=127.19 GHVH01001323.1:389-3859(+)